MNLEEEKVKCRPLKKYPCKRNKGEHEWSNPVLVSANIEYVHKVDNGAMYSSSLDKKYKLIKTYLTVHLITSCKYCGKKSTHFLRDKII